MIKYFDSLKYEVIEEKNYRLNHENLNIPIIFNYN